jgi:mRNA interferase RelE/StbE
MYRIVISKGIEKLLDKLPDDVSSRVFTRLSNLEANPRPPDVKKLKGRNVWRIRIGDYRVLYEIHDRNLQVIVVTLGHRRDVYR